MKKFLLIFTIVFTACFLTACDLPPAINNVMYKFNFFDKIQSSIQNFKLPEIDFEKELLKKIEKRGVVKIGVKFDAKQFGYMNPRTNELEGFEIDLAKDITKLIFGENQKIEFIPVTPSDRIEKVNGGEVDMIIATMTIDLLRLEILDFSNPYYVAGQAIMVKNESNIKSMSDLSDKKVGIIFGSTAEKNMARIAPKTIIFGYRTYDEAVDALLRNEIDAVTSDDSLLIGYTMNNPNLKLLPKRYSQEPYGVAFQKTENSTSLRHKVNFAIETFYKSGELETLRKKWIN